MVEISTKTRKLTRLSKVTGTEGPSYDPYHYEEITIQRGEENEFKVVYHHGGLVDYLKVTINGETEIIHDTIDNLDFEQKFYEIVGLSLNDIYKALNIKENPKKCRICGSKKWFDAGGFPGESITLCHNGHVVDYYFNMGAII
jgi:hypothetical protein